MRHKRREVTRRAAGQEGERLVGQLEAAPLRPASQRVGLFRFRERLEAVDLRGGQARCEVRQAHRGCRRAAGGRNRKAAPVFGEAVVEREDRGLEGRVARDRVDVVERNQGELLEAVEQLRAVRAQLCERQVGGGTPAAARFCASGLQQVTAARSRRDRTPRPARLEAPSASRRSASMAAALAPAVNVSKRSETPSWTPSGSCRTASGGAAASAAHDDRLANVRQHVVDAADDRRHQDECAEALHQPVREVAESRLPDDRDDVQELHQRIELRRQVGRPSTGPNSHL